MTRVFKKRKRKRERGREGGRKGGRKEEKEGEERKKANILKCPPHFSYHLRSMLSPLFKQMRKSLRL